MTSTTSIIGTSAHHQLFSLLNDKLPGCRCAHIRSGIRLLHLSNDEETSAILRGSALGQQAALLCPLDAQLLSLCLGAWLRATVNLTVFPSSTICIIGSETVTKIGG